MTAWVHAARRVVFLMYELHSTFHFLLDMNVVSKLSIAFRLFLGYVQGLPKQ